MESTSSPPSQRTSAFHAVKHEPELTELKTPSQVPSILPGVGIQNRIPAPSCLPQEMLIQMFQPYQNGYYLPPEVFGRPNVLSQCGEVAKDPALQQIRQQHEDRDSGNESTTLSPVSSFSSSRSPSNSSRSNSFSMSTLLKSDILTPGTASAQPTPLAQIPTTLPHQSSNFGLGSSLPPLIGKQVNTPLSTNTAQLSIPPHLNPALFGPKHPLPFPPMTLGPPQMPMNAQLIGQIHQYEQFRRMTQAPNPPFDPLMSGPYREMCDICGDNASGYHYGVMSCEGCKGFFRRTVQRNNIYKCHRDSSCKIDRVSRNRCQACRYQRCVEKGMAKESVRLDRTKKSKKNDEETLAQLEEVKELMENIREIITNFKTAFSNEIKVMSVQDVTMRCTLFISNLKLFSELEKEDHAFMANKATRGVTLLRAALSQDDCSKILNENELIQKIRAGIEIASYEDLAVLTAVYLASFSGDSELQDQVSRCLRSQLKTRLSVEEHLYTALMSKLALLE